MSYSTLATFKSKSKSGERTHAVKLNSETGHLSCGCPVWIYNRNGDRTCYHTEKVRANNAVAGLEKTAKAPSTPDGQISYGGKERPRRVKGT